MDYEGEILLGQDNVKKLGNSTVRNYVGTVFQEPFIFSDTVKNNVDVLEKYNNEKIEKVCKICEIDKDIQGFPNKYNEILGNITEMFDTVCVSGTHGKTTTSTLITHILDSIYKVNYF